MNTTEGLYDSTVNFLQNRYIPVVPCFTRFCNGVLFGLASDIKEKKLKNALAHMKGFRISSVRTSLFTNVYTFTHLRFHGMKQAIDYRTLEIGYVVELEFNLKIMKGHLVGSL